MRGYSGVDSLLAGVVALVIGYTGFSLARQTVSKLIGEKPSEELLEKVHNVTRATHGVRDTHKIMVHDYGGSTHISLHIQVDPELQVTESHEIASHVKYRVASETGAEVIVHVEPHG